MNRYDGGLVMRTAGALEVVNIAIAEQARW